MALKVLMLRRERDRLNKQLETLRENEEKFKLREEDLAKAIGLQVSGDLTQDQYLLADALLALTKELGIKTLQEQGISKDDFDMLAGDVLHEPVLGFNPRENITKEDVLDILEQAF